MVGCGTRESDLLRRSVQTVVWVTIVREAGGVNAHPANQLPMDLLAR